jgi:hypothetical protein
MIDIKVKLKHEDKKYEETLHVCENFSICKENPILQNKVKEVIKASGFPEIDKCKISSTFEW